MDVESIVSDVKARTDLVVTRGQEVLDLGLETFKTANTIVVEGVQSLLETNVSAGKQLVDLTQASFVKAKADGFKAVAANPVAYLPEGKTTVVGAYSDSMATVTKTSDELAKTFMSGYSSISAKIAGKSTPVKAAATKATKAAKKAVRKTAKKVAKAAA